MIYEIINTYDYLHEFKRIHVKIEDEFSDYIKLAIKNKFRTLNNYCNYSGIKKGVLYWQFSKYNYHQFRRLLKIFIDLKLSKEELYNNILGFYYWGSHDKNYLEVPKELEIDEFFIEGYALYLAEGRTGFSGTTKPRKFIFVNSEIEVINYMIQWFKKYFSKLPFFIQVDIPNEFENIDQNHIIKIIFHNNIKFAKGRYNKILKYQLCCKRAILIDLILAFEQKIKEICKKDKSLARAYIRGMMIGEGTAYFNRSRYVRIEMKNKEEIHYLHEIFTMLGFKCKPSLRTTRENMWSIYIGAKQLKKYYDEIGFGVHKKRQRILKSAVNKKLRVNQYC